MKKTIEVTSKKVDDAIKEGLRILGVSMTDDGVDIRIISHGGFLKKARVEISVGEDDPVPAKPIEAPAAKVISKETKQESKFENKAQKENKEPSSAVAPKNAFQGNPRQNVQANSNKPGQTAAQNMPQNNQQSKPQSNNPLGGQSRAQNKPQDGKNNAANENRQAAPANKKPPVQKEKRNFDDEKPQSAPATAEHIEKSKAFLGNVLKLCAIEGTVEVKAQNGLDIEIETADSAIIGYRGEMLDSLQYLTSLIINENDNKHIRVALDALGYREKRIETLKRLAQKMAEKALANQRKVSLEPMSSAERRIIHATLSENAGIITRSEGHDPNRRVVILPVRK